MTFQTLPAEPTPDVNIMRSNKPNTKVAQFGDGYSQRTTFGINQTALAVDLSWSFLNVNEKATLETFFKANDNGTAFYWAMPDESTPRKWYVTEWAVVYVAYNVYTVTAKFAEVFDIE